MKSRSFFLRLFVGNLLLVVVIIAVASLVFYNAVNQRVYRSDQQSQDQMLRMAQHHFQASWPLQGEMENRVYRQLMPGPAIRLTVVDAAGKVLVDSWADPARMENHNTPERKELVSALAGQSGIDTRPSGTLNKAPFRYMALPIEKEGRVVGAVRVAMAVRAIVEHEGFVRSALLWAGISATAAAIVLALLVSWVWSRPLRQITHAARKIASGNLNYRAQISGSTELAQLGTALNEMRDSLAQQINLVAAQRQSFQTVVANLREGVVAIASDGRIVLMNRSAGRMLADGAETAADQHFQAVLALPEVAQIFHDVLGSAQTIDREIEVDLQGQRRILQASASPVPPAPANDIAALLVVRDVTEQARMAAMKAEFVANASHELRTPLATIRAAVESLETVGVEDAEAFRKFVSILGRQVARLENMTRDLLDLHLVERSRTRLRQDETNSRAVVEWTRQQMAPLADEKRVEMVVGSEGDGAAFRTDWTLLQLIVQNLVENAIKFTPAGGRVECLVQAQDGQLVVRVSDTGCGIPPSMQERVFERFFQVDPSRSGDASKRGTGLGLAIVKHAVERLGGRVSLQSEVDKGTVVTVSVPNR